MQQTTSQGSIKRRYTSVEAPITRKKRKSLMDIENDFKTKKRPDPSDYTWSAILSRHEQRTNGNNLTETIISKPVESIELNLIYANNRRTLKLLESAEFRRISVVEEDKRDRIVNLYVNGALVPELVKLFRLTEKEIRLILSISCESYKDLNNIEKANKGAKTKLSNKSKGVKHTFTDEQKEKMRLRYLDGEVVSKIADTYDISPKTLRKIVYKFPECRAFANERVKPELYKKGKSNDK